nr:hypothetical protein [Tanacetum cinerariifolium]
MLSLSLICFRQPPAVAGHHRRHLPSPKKFSGELSGRNQTHFLSPDLLDPPHHSPPRAATTSKTTTTAAPRCYHHHNYDTNATDPSPTSPLTRCHHRHLTSRNHLSKHRGALFFICIAPKGASGSTINTQRGAFRLGLKRPTKGSGPCTLCSCSELDSISNEMLEFFQHVFPTSKGYKLPPSYYIIKKTFKMIELGYKSIHAWKKVPKKVLCCLLIIPRLQHLYKSSHTAKEMTWHATGKCTEPDKIQHPVDGRAWKNFVTNYSDFAKEPRNVKLGLAADGFSLFDNLSQSYSMWSVILTTYNLPPWLCMKESSFMLTLLIPGPKSSGKDINVYLRPLIDDLKDLWALKGVKTIDIATGHKFNMRAMVLWTINDFLARCSLSGWSGQGYKACPTSKPKGLIAEGYVAKEALTFSSHYFQDVTMKFNRPNHNMDCPSQHVSLGVPISIPEIDMYRAKFKSEFPNQDMKEEFLGWFESQIFQRHIDKDPSVSASSELFTLACRPTPTPISVNSCILNGVRFVVHNRDERRITQNSSICSPGDKDREMYYGQLEEFLKFSYMSFKVVLFRAEWFDTSNEGHALPHDLADSDDEDLFNVDDDDMSADVARGYDGDGGGDDHPPPHQIYGGCRDRSGVPDALPFLAQHPEGAEGGGHRKD